MKNSIELNSMEVKFLDRKQTVLEVTLQIISYRLSDQQVSYPELSINLHFCCIS